MDRTESAKRLYVEEIARLVAQGLDIEAIAIKINLDIPFIHQCIADSQFDECFQAIDGDKFTAWKDQKTREAQTKRVKEMAQMDAVKHYEMLRDIAQDRKANLDDKDRATILERLIKMSGVVDSDAVHEVVTLNPDQIHNINAAWNETLDE